MKPATSRSSCDARTIARRNAGRASGQADDLSGLVELHGLAPVTDSRRVADHFGKRHDVVLRAFDLLGCDVEFSRRNFVVAAELDAQGKPRRIVRMTKDGFMLLAMGFTGAKAMAMKIAYINAFNAMAERLQHLEAINARTAWEQLMRVEKMDASSREWASFGSQRMHDRRRAIPLIEGEMRRLQRELQHDLFVTVGSRMGGCL